MAELSYFGWDEYHSEGYDAETIGRTNDSNEIDLTDTEVKYLISDWQQRLKRGEHITLRIEEVGE